MKASKTPTIFPIPTFSPRRSLSFDSLSLAQDDPEPGPRRFPETRRGVEDLEAALEQFREIANDLGTANRSKNE
jgi:hypothetical protein